MEAIWAVYAGLFFAPFVQEDAAVFGAAGASAMGLASPVGAYLAALAGLTASDVWKYWAGRYASTHAWAKRLIAKPGVCAARDRVLGNLAKTMFAARFIPGTRVPLYLAAGAFGAPFWPFLAYIVLSGALYIGAAFALVKGLGALVGREAAMWLPAAAIGAALIYVAARWLMRRERRSGNKAPEPDVPSQA